MKIIDKIKKLNLPLGKYVLFGSGVLEVYGIREARDIDILTIPEIYEQLKRTREWEEKEWPSGDKYLVKNNFEVVTEWKYNSYDPDVEKLIREADVVDGIPLAKLEEVLAWKKAFGREKDLKDIELINIYLHKNN